MDDWRRARALYGPHTPWLPPPQPAPPPAGPPPGPPSWCWCCRSAGARSPYRDYATHGADAARQGVGLRPGPACPDGTAADGVADGDGDEDDDGDELVMSEELKALFRRGELRRAAKRRAERDAWVAVSAPDAGEPTASERHAARLAEARRKHGANAELVVAEEDEAAYAAACAEA